MSKLRLVLLVLVLSLSTVGRGDNSTGDVRFHGTEIPAPPANNESWTSPEEPVFLAKAADLLFGLGMADPRGCEYRQIKVMTGNVWGNYNGDQWNPGGTAIQTHGWVLPTVGKSTLRFAVCWNGWVYPVLAVGDLCSVEEDVKKQLQPVDKTKNPQEFFKRGLWNYTDAVDDQDALSYETPVPIKTVLLMRLGKSDLASALWMSSNKSPDVPDPAEPQDLKGTFEVLTTSWLFSLFNRAICAQMRGDDDLALVSFRQLASSLPEAKKIYASFPVPANQPTYQEGPFDFLKEVPNYLADMERRHQEPPRQAALTLGRHKFPNKAAWIKALITDLEDVQAPQDGQPGWVELERNATIKALVQEGNDAVEPLIDCLEHDNRYTRSVHFWRDFAPDRTVLGADEAAYTALTGIFQTSFFDIHSTGQDLTNSGPEARAKVVAALRAYWEKRKGTSVEDQWFITLADDNAKPEEWGVAALNIAKSGESLRPKKNPDVTGLMEKRLKALSTQNMADVFKQQPAPQIADALLTWAGPAAIDAVRDFCNAMAARFALENNTGDGLARPLSALTERLIGMGDKQILNDYAGWLKSVPPENVGDFQVIDLWFKPLWENPDTDAVQKADADIFTNKDSAWVHFFHDKLGTNEGLALLRSPLIGMPGFRRMLLAGLADQTLAGESGYLVGNFWMVRYGFGEQANQVMAQLNPLDPLSKMAGNDTYRVCDLYGWGLGEAKAGLPALQFYWPVARRDAAIAQTIQTLQRYGERYQVSAAHPVVVDYTLGANGYAASPTFPPLDHPATPDDVQKGLAIFSLPPEAKARVWTMPNPGATARWLAIKDFSDSAGFGDGTGFQRIITGFKNSGHVWQAEEGFIDGKWQRFFGFVGEHCIARAPAEEIDFPTKWLPDELDQGLDCKLASNDNYYKKPLQAGATFPLTLKLRSRRGIEQNVPDTLYQSDIKALAEGVEIHLYRKNIPAAGEIVKDSKLRSTWDEMSRKSLPHFPLPALTHTLAPTADLEVISCNLNDFYDLSQPGEYYVEMTFDSANLKFTGGTTSPLMFKIK